MGEDRKQKWLEKRVIFMLEFVIGMRNQAVSKPVLDQIMEKDRSAIHSFAKAINYDPESYIQMYNDRVGN